MRVVLIQHGLWKVLSGPYTKPEKMTKENWAADQKKRRGSLTDEEWEELKLKALSAIHCAWHHMSYERCLIRQLRWIFGFGWRNST